MVKGGAGGGGRERGVEVRSEDTEAEGKRADGGLLSVITQL